MIDHFVIPSFGLFLLAASMRMSMRLLYGARGPAPEDAVHMILSIMSWILIIVPGTVVVVAGAQWLSLLLITVIFAGLFELALARRAAQRQAVWRLVAGAVTRGRSLVDALRLHQRRFSGVVGRAQRRLLADLERGAAWQQAVSANRRAVPREAPAFAAMWNSGAAPARLLDDLDEARDPAYVAVRQLTMQRLIYLTTICLAMIGIVAFVVIQILPSYRAIFQDFDLELPAMTTQFIAISNSLGRSFVGPRSLENLIVLVPVVALGLLAIVLLYLLDVPVLQRLTDRLGMSRHRAQVMRLLAMALEQRRPIDAALAVLSAGATAYPSALLRRRLAAALRRVQAGDEWAEALARYHVISSGDAGALRTAQSAGNVPWMLRLLADRKVHRATFRWSMVQQFAFVAIILMIAAFVFWFAAAMLVPLADMVLKLSELEMGS
jgi:type II secretory pathway component PulF